MSAPLTNEQKIPSWMYACVILLGPAIMVLAIHGLFKAVDFLWGWLAKFDYWWAVGLVGLYLLSGVLLAGWLSSLEEEEHD